MNKNHLPALVLAVLSALASLSAHAQSGPTTTYSYDARGNLSGIGLPSGRTRALQWDALGRNTAQTGSGATVGYGYNGQDRLTAVLDPKGLATAYTRNGHGEATDQSSPDTGSSSFSFDANGNLAQRVNAAGQVESYTYDAADRPLTKTLAHPVSGTLTYAFTYGTSGPSAGRLVQVTASSVSLGYSHNLFGQVTSATQTVNGGPTLSAAFGYSTAGALSSVTYPSGRVVIFNLDGTSRVSSVASGGSTLLSGVAYSPLGFIAGWTFGNGQTVTRTFDLNGRMSSVTLPTGQRTYGYDVDDRITSVTDPVLGNAAYGYDNLDRLTSANTAQGQWGYWYDANGNRIQHTINGSGYALSVDSASNRTLQGSAPVARDTLYSADGQTASVNGGTPQPNCGTAVTMGYSADGQLVTSNVLSAVYGPSGLRLQKTSAACAGGTTTNFVYDPAGHLIGEYDASGAVIQETVWVGDIPVAVFKSNGVAVVPYYVYSDNLNTPRAITNTAGQLVWRWDGEPFGATAADENPSSLGQFVYGLRFPGQYFDAETGYHQNRWREYDPKMGRYLQSDPIGLAGGLNTYLYADANPLAKSDPSGQNAILWGARGGAALGSMFFPGIGTAVGAAVGALGVYAVSSLYQQWALPAGQTGARTAQATWEPDCNGVVPVYIDSGLYPEVASHIRAAVAAGHPSTVTVDRPGATQRRKDSMAYSQMPAMARDTNLDRDEWPMAMFQEGGAGSSVRYLNASQNRAAGNAVRLQCAPVRNGCPIQVVVH